MTVVDLLAELRELDVHIELDGERLRLNAPAGVLTGELKRDLAEHKPEVVAFLREAQRLATQQRAIVPLQPGGTQTPIYAVAGHNGDVFSYLALSHHLGTSQPFFGLQPLGLEEGTEPLTRVEDIARYFADQIRVFQPVGPVIIAGYCAGGSIAFELARQLTNSGVTVTNLMLFGAPFCTFYRRLQWTIAVVRHFGGRVGVHGRRLFRMPVSERRRYVRDRATHLVESVRGWRAQQPDEATDPVLIRRRAVVRATLAAARAYVPQPAGMHIDVMVPCTSWQGSAAHPLRWSRFGASTTRFAGPDGCSSDTMLLPDQVATFAGYVEQARRSRATSGAL